jgi:modulator of FtsH protease HflK
MSNENTFNDGVAPVPSPPSSGERVRVRGQGGEHGPDSSASSQPARATASESGQRTLDRPPHPNPLPPQTGGEGTRVAPRNGMTPRWLLLALAVVVYFANGLFTVPANEVAVVRRCGRVVMPARSSGLHFDLPWPFVRVDRVNLNASRSLSIGESTLEPNAFLQPVSSAPTTFLTGDKNLLQLRVVVQYRVSEEFLADWLYASERPEQRLRLLVETTVADLVSRSGVDFVHTQGLAELNNRLLMAVREQATRQRFGCEIEQVTIDRAEPPARVKAEFLDVSNARADRARSIHEARSYAEQKRAESQADARQFVDAAEQARRTQGSAAQGSADRFVSLVEQMRQDAASRGRDYDSSRALTMNRLYVETLRDVLGRAKSKVVLDGPQPADIMLPTGRPTANEER